MSDVVHIDRAAGAADSGAVPSEASAGEQLAALVVWGAGLFYWAEAGENPSVKTYWDAFHYISTSLSVGYANIFPVTQIGKAIGAVVMMVGPALSARALETGAKAAEPDLAGKLDEILVELRKLNARE
jgi:hypothetical protein